ncbi:putative hydrolase [Salmonella enterica subsp. arizonae]|uniref:Putative hydrolase n=1 Tax=Salmonella enterica subsp. arizonae TaxID=59203 RepID=A0A379SRB3_SALER|nr:putative hydrolase [Salmonella enterica subsp. arizonae]
MPISSFFNRKRKKEDSSSLPVLIWSRLGQNDMKMLRIYGAQMANIIPTVRRIYFRLNVDGILRKAIKWPCFNCRLQRWGLIFAMKQKSLSVPRHWRSRGVELVLTPSATFTEQGFWRVRHCCHSRCIENQIYLVHCCLGGNPGGPLPGCWARSSILSPCDVVWKNPEGIIAEAHVNKEDVISGEINLDVLYENRLEGAATTFKDRRRKAGIYNIWPSHIK